MKYDKNDVKELYVIKDLLADEIGPIFQAKNLSVAMRSFNQLMQDVVHVEDYMLIRVGYMQSDGTLIPELEIVDIYKEVKEHEKATLSEG